MARLGQRKGATSNTWDMLGDVKMYVKETRWEGLGGINLAQKMDK
jgi:hypothetical protein